MLRLVNRMLYYLFCVLFEFISNAFSEDKCIAEDGVPPAPIKTQEELQDELLKYIREKHDVEEFREILNKVLDVNFFRENKRTPLMVAVKKNKRAFVKELLKRVGKGVNAQDNIGFTALHHAVSANNPGIVNLLLDDLRIDDSLKLKTCMELTPLQLAKKWKPDPLDKKLNQENGEIITALTKYEEIAADLKKRSEKWNK